MAVGHCVKDSMAASLEAALNTVNPQPLSLLLQQLDSLAGVRAKGAADYKRVPLAVAFESFVIGGDDPRVGLRCVHPGRFAQSAALAGVEASPSHLLTLPACRALQGHAGAARQARAEETCRGRHLCGPLPVSATVPTGGCKTWRPSAL